MVGIFKYSLGLHFVAISDNEHEAIQVLFNKYASNPQWYRNAEEWFTKVGSNSFVIEEVEKW